MTRELRRVKLDFKWPLKKVWPGLLNPYTDNCPDCVGGFSQYYDQLREKWYAGWQHNLSQEEVDVLTNNKRLEQFTSNGLRKPTAEQINQWSKTDLFGHDAVNAHVVIKHTLKKQGLNYQCETCNGSGTLDKEKADKWTKSYPEEGMGFQLWETTTEGSPVTPVFDSLDKLADYCVNNKVSIFGSKYLNKEQWLEMFDSEEFCFSNGKFTFV